MMKPSEVAEFFTKAESEQDCQSALVKAHKRIKQYAGLVEFLTEQLVLSHTTVAIFLLAMRNSDPNKIQLEICQVAEAELRGLQQRFMAEMLDPEDSREPQEKN
jgi:hypothetical protein